MPTLMLRGLDPALVARVRAYAKASDRTLIDAAAHLLDLGLQAAQARASGAHAVNEALTPDERTARAQKAARVRWASHQRAP